MTDEPKLSEDYTPLLAQLAEAPALSDLSLEEARARWDMMDFGEAEPLHEVRDLVIPGPASPIAARLYLPSADPTALIVFLHGGGWALGGLSSHDKTIRGLALRSGAAFLAIDYRLAPETPFPGPLEDAVAATAWAEANAGQLVGTRKPLLIAGDSAGGNLAAAVAIHARDHGGPELDGQVLIYPATDAGMQTQSYRTRGNGGMMSGKDMAWFWDQYVPDVSMRDDPRASVSRTKDLSNLPPALVVTAEFDPLRDEGQAYVKRLKDAGVTAECLHFGDQPHGFLTFYQFAPSAGSAFEEIGRAIAQLA
ncbi:alpha/beta hydrolase [Novosphingobium malaysiense]|uniref:alpha/beta hydrolase n=1 Tax=Novosphingobium malaysiense TaxID=1348853 RepID=UPI0006919FB9|nr:alpha/beta hydrolase [Novosphingobium malaysiense]